MVINVFTVNSVSGVIPSAGNANALISNGWIIHRSDLNHEPEQRLLEHFLDNDDYKEFKWFMEGENNLFLKDVWSYSLETWLKWSAKFDVFKNVSFGNVGFCVLYKKIHCFLCKNVILFLALDTVTG